ncbi:MAG: hypothetical protein IJ632_05800 [Muribaculaceae bacterium]|nr:hypothetical protein [Muribaculaceae bacterium]
MSYNRLVTFFTCLAAALCGMASLPDTVKVIDHPDKVVLIKNGNVVQVNVTGIDGHADSTYQYTVKSTERERMRTQEKEKEHIYGYGHGFVLNRKKCEQVDGKPHFDLFISGFYLGWGHTNATGAFHGTTGTTFEAGILNVLGLGYHFGNRNRLSLGVGYQAKFHALKKDYQFVQNDAQQLVIEKYPSDYKHQSSQLLIHSMQFPLLYAKGIGKWVWLYGGGVMNWNFEAVFDRKFETGKTQVSETTRGLNQSKITFDILAGLQWRSIGAFFRYSPQQVLKDGYGPELNKSWIVGVAIGF